MSPTLTLISMTMPAAADGISIDALSLSTRDERLLGLDRVAGLDQHLDDLDVLEVADVRDLDFHCGHVLVVLVRDRSQAYSGLILSTLIPYLAIASATFVAGTLPSSASAFSAATTM